MRGLASFVVFALVALLAAAVVSAGNPTKEQIERTAAGNARAKSEVLRHADVGSGWSGGFKKPDLSSTLHCDYHPKQSDLVLIGAAEADWRRQAFTIDSEAQVLRTPAMVRKDWRRSVLAPQVLPCLRQDFKHSLGSKAELVSARRVAFPRLATYTRAFRFVAKVKTEIGQVAVEFDFVALGAGRNELSLALGGPAVMRAFLHDKELHLARVLARRAGS